MNVARALFSWVRNVVAWILRSLWRQDISRIKDKPAKEDDRSPTEGDRPKLVDWSAEKVKFLSMPLSEKRKLYHCGNNYVTLREIPTWKEYFQAGKEFLKKLAEGQLTDSCNIDPELNDKVSLWRGDITTLEVDIIVNAANETLLGGGGVDGAIHTAAGKRLKEECASLNGCPIGDAKITGGYQLPAKYVIHTVGPEKSGDDELTSCYQHSLDIMKQMEQRTIAFPCISTGIYGFPNEKAATIALETTKHFLEANKDRVDRIIFCVFLPNDCMIYERLMQKYFPVEPPDASPISKDATNQQSDVSSTKEVPSEGTVEADTSPELAKEKPQEEQSQEVESKVDTKKADRDAIESQQQPGTAENKVISPPTVVPPQIDSTTEKHDEIIEQVADTPEGVSAAAENAPEVNLDQAGQSGASGEEQKPSTDEPVDVAAGSEPEGRQKLDLETHPEQQEMKVESAEPQVQAEAASTENTPDTTAAEPGSPISKPTGEEEQPANGIKEKDDASFAQTEKNESSVLTGDDDSQDFEQISASEAPTKSNGEPQASDQQVALDTNENLSPATKVDPNKAPSD